MEWRSGQFEIGLQQASHISQRFWCNTAKRREPYPCAVHSYFLIVADRGGEAVGPVEAHRNIAVENPAFPLRAVPHLWHRAIRLRQFHRESDGHPRSSRPA